MDEKAIIQLFYDRNESALSELSKMYGKYFVGVAERILHNYEDSMECVNEAYLRAWNSIPPARPNALKAFVGKLVKCAAVSMLRVSSAEKRGKGEIVPVLDELGDVVSDNGSVENEFKGKQIVDEINKFLWKSSEFNRRAFVLRYWHCFSISEIAGRLGASENKVAVSLFRTRQKLKQHLVKEGYIV